MGSKHKRSWWLIFTDLRDRYGITQLTVDINGNESLFQKQKILVENLF